MDGLILPSQGVATDEHDLLVERDERAPHQGAEPLGVLARRLEARGLRKRPLSQWLSRRIGIRLLDVVRILFYTSRLARRLRIEFGVSILTQLAAQFDLAFRRGIDPSLYYFEELYKPGPLARIDDYFTRREVKGALLRLMHRLEPPAAERRINLGDKLQFTAWCARTNLAHVAPLMLIEGGHIVWQAGDLLALDRDLFVKPRVSRGARGAALYRRIAPMRFQDRARRSMTLGTIVADLVRRFKSTNLMILPRLHNHPELADLASESLITVRAVTCLNERHQPELVVAYLRILTKLEHAWTVKAPITEYAAAVDLTSGRLSKMTGDQPECLSDWHDRHPVTGAQVLGRVVPCWDDVISLAERAHRVTRDRVLVGWDIAITPDGPLLLEGNSYPDVHYPQRIYKRPYGEMRIGQLLRHHMMRLENKWSQEG